MSNFLTIGMPTYKDFDGVYFTIQALRMYHDLNDVELLVVDTEEKSNKDNRDFFKSTEIKFDIDPKDFHTITQHEQFMELLGGMAKAINKSVLITGENEPEQILITIQA